MPNPLSWLLHKSPAIIHQLEVAGNHVVELLVPWLMVAGNRAANITCGVMQIAFQVRSLDTYCLELFSSLPPGADYEF